MPEGSVSLVDELRSQESAWANRPVVRRLYADWYDLIVSRLADVPGTTVELGSGISRFKEHCPGVVTTDVEETPWADAIVDAERLPYEDGSVANLVLIDVLHHLGSPSRFFETAARALAPRGRVVILDPYCSTVSYRAYRLFHHERTSLDVDPFEADTASAVSPMLANQAQATLIFFRNLAEFEARWPEFAVIERRRLALLAYPLSGGFSRRPLLPDKLLRAALALERVLAPLAPLLAFRCVVVLERRGAA